MVAHRDAHDHSVFLFEQGSAPVVFANHLAQHTPLLRGEKPEAGGRDLARWRGGAHRSPKSRTRLFRTSFHFPKAELKSCLFRKLTCSRVCLTAGPLVATVVATPFV